MEITKIELSNYKSLKEPVTLHFRKGLPTVLIGKNGSGKTNILEALEIATCHSSHNRYPPEKIPFFYRIHMKLSEQEFSALAPGHAYSEETLHFSVYSSESSQRPNCLCSNYIVPLLKTQAEDIPSLISGLQKALSDYARQLKKIACDDWEPAGLRCFEIYDFKGHTTNYQTHLSHTERLVKEAQRCLAQLQQSFIVKDGVQTLVFTADIGIPWFTDNDYQFQLQYLEPDLAPFEKKYISIDTALIKKEIDKINLKTKDACARINKYIEEINRRFQYFNSYPAENDSSENDNKYFRFLRQVQKLIEKRCLFLSSDSTHLLFHTPDFSQLTARDSTRSIIETYLKKLYTGPDKAEKLDNFMHGNDFSLTQTDLEDLEKCLNQSLPPFERGMYSKLSVELSNSKPTIFVHENAGEKIELNRTSAGRRWYFTYYFMRGTLEQGDLFLIDEPVATLHPQAQKEIRGQLLDLACQGVQVVYSTHSPYLIPNEWKCAHFVSMGEHGTEVTPVENGGEAIEPMKEIAGNDIFDLQEIYEAYNHCPVDRLAENCYKAVAEYKTRSSQPEEVYTKLHISTETVKS